MCNNKDLERRKTENKCVVFRDNLKIITVMVNGRIHLRNVLLGNWVTLQHRSMHSPNHMPVLLLSDMTLGTTAVGQEV